MTIRTCICTVLLPMGFSLHAQTNYTSVTSGQWSKTAPDAPTATGEINRHLSIIYKPMQ